MYFLKATLLHDMSTVGSRSRWIKVHLSVNTRQLFTPLVQRWGGFTWSLCVESGQRALFSSDLLSYNNNHNPQPDQNTQIPSWCLRSPVQKLLGGAFGLPTSHWGPPHIWPDLRQALHPVKAQVCGNCFVGAEQGCQMPWLPLKGQFASFIMQI